MKKKARLYACHSWLGLVTGILLLLVSVSGAVLVFHKELDRATFPAAARLKEPVQELVYDRAVASVQSRYPYHRLRVHLPEDPYKKALIFEARGTDNQRYVYVHPQSGEILLDVDRFSTPSRWLLKLHYTLFAGVWGSFLLAILGLSMIASLFTGLWVYRKRLVPVLLFREKLSLKSRKGFYSGTHRYIGVWSLLLNLVLAVTGVFIQVVIIGSNLSSKKAVVAPSPGPQVSLDKAMALLRLEKEHFSPAFLMLPTDSLSPIVVYGKSRETHPMLPPYADVLKIETEGYTQAGLDLIAQQPMGVKVYSWVIALHFGSFGGMPVKLLYCLFGLAPAWLSITGWFLWQKRRKGQKKQQEKKPKPRVKPVLAEF